MNKYLWQGWRKFVTLGLGIPSFFLISLLIYIQITFSPEKIRLQAVDFLSSKLDRPVDIQGASLSLWPLGFELKGLKLGAPKDTLFSREDMLELPSLVFKADLSELLLFKLRIHQIKISDLKVRYEVLADGRTNLDGLSSPDTTKKSSKPVEWDKLTLPGAFKMDAFEIKNASIVYVDRKSAREITLGKLNEKMSLSLDSTLENIKSQGILSIKDIQVKDAALGLRQGGIDISVSHHILANLRKQHIEIQELKATLEKTTLSLKAVVDSAFTKPSASVEWNSNQINLTELFALVPKSLHPELPKVSVSGQVQTSGQAQIIPSQKPKINLSLKVSALKLAHSEAPAQVDHLSFDLKTDAEQVSLSNFQASIDGQKIIMKLQAHGLQSKPYLDGLDLQADLNLGRIMALAERLAVLPKGYAVQGQLKADIQGSGPMDIKTPQNLKINGLVNLNNLQVKAPQLPEILNYTGEIALNNMEIKQKGQLNFGTTQLIQEAGVRNYLALALPTMTQGQVAEISFKANSPMLDVDKLLAMLGGGAPKKDEPTAPMTSYPELPQNIKAHIQMNLAQAVAMGVSVKAIQTQIEYNPNSINANWKASIFGGNLSQDLNLKILNAQNASIQTKFNAVGVEANDMISLMADKLSDAPLHKELKKMKGVFYGKATVLADLSMNGAPAELTKTVDGKLSIKAHEGQIKQCPQTVALANGFNSGLQTLQKWLPMVQEIQQLKLPSQLNFNTIQGDLYLEKGNLVIKKWDYEQSALGLLLALGTVGLDTKLNMSLDYLVPKILSQKILTLQKSALDAAGQLNPIKGFALPSGINAVPVKDSRVFLPFIIAGTFANPQIQLDMNKVKLQGANFKDMFKDLLKAKADSLKALGLAKLNEEKAKLEAKANTLKSEALSKANAAKAEAEAKASALKAEAERRAAEEKRKAEEKAKQEIKNKTGDALKKFGF